MENVRLLYYEQRITQLTFKETPGVKRHKTSWIQSFSLVMFLTLMPVNFEGRKEGDSPKTKALIKSSKNTDCLLTILCMCSL